MHGTNLAHLTMSPNRAPLSCRPPPERSVDGGYRQDYTFAILTVSPALRTKIESLGVHLPEGEVRTKDILDGCRRRILVPLERWSGISSRRMAGKSEFSIDLAERAIANCFERSDYSPRDVDLLICCNISKVDSATSGSLEPTTAHDLVERFDFGNIANFDVSNACAGLFTGIMVADRLLHHHVVNRVLVVSGEYITHLTTNAQREIQNARDRRLACLTLGDAAAALILERTAHPNVGFTSLELRSAPEHADLCIAHATDQQHGGAIMFTDTVGLAQAGTENAVLHIKEIVDRAGYDWDYANHWITHQTSSRALRAGAAQLNRLAGTSVVTPGNNVDNLRNRGNTATTSHWVALQDSVDSGRINDGDTVAFSIAASGVTVGVAFYELGDLPHRIRAAEGENGSNGAVLSAPVANGVNGNGTNGHKAKAKSNGNGDGADGEGDHLGPQSAGGPLYHQLRQRVRVEQIGLAPPVEHPTDDEITAAVRAAWSCLSHSEYDAGDIDLLLFTGVYRQKFLSEPALATLVANKLGITGALESGVRSRFLAFDVLNGALGCLTATWIACNLINTGEVRVAMIVNAECVQHQKRNDKLGLVDAASAIILDRGDGSNGFEAFSFRSEFAGQDSYATTANWTGGGAARLGVEGDPERGRAAALPFLADTFQAHLESTGLERGSIDVLIGPQAASGYGSQVADALELPDDKVVDLEYGAIYSSALPFGLRRVWDNATPGQQVAILDFASGMQIGCATYRS